MKTINRAVAVIKPKQPYIDWVNHLPDNQDWVTVANLQTDCTAILIPEFDREKKSKAFIDTLAESIFEEELAGWCTGEACWPKKRTKKMFREWFDVEVHSVVLEAGKGLIKKEAV